MMNKITEPFITIIKNRELIWEMSKKDIIDKYKGQPLGVIWAVVHPMVMILIYIFLFGIVFKTRMGTDEGQQSLSFAAYLLSGMVPWLMIQTALTSGSIAVTSNRMLIKQVIFPAEVLPIKMVGSALIIEIIYIAIDLVYCLITTRILAWSYLLLPIALLIQVIFVIGLNYIVSSINVYLKDIKDVVQVICMIGIYTIPVIYTPDAVPSLFQKIIYINPLSHIIWMFQDIMYFRGIQHWYSWIISLLEALIMLYLGDGVFRKLKIGFGSAL